MIWSRGRKEKGDEAALGEGREEGGEGNRLRSTRMRFSLHRRLVIITICCSLLIFGVFADADTLTQAAKNGRRRHRRLIDDSNSKPKVYLPWAHPPPDALVREKPGNRLHRVERAAAAVAAAATRIDLVPAMGGGGGDRRHRELRRAAARHLGLCDCPFDCLKVEGIRFHNVRLTGEYPQC